MPIFRTLLIFLVLYLAFKIGRTLYRSHRLRQAPAPTPNKIISATVVRCAICGVHVPKTEAISINGRYACCESHARELSSQA